MQLAVATFGPLSKDVENQLRAIDHVEIGVLGDRAGLGGRQLAIEHEGTRVLFDRAHDYVFEFAFAEHELRIDPIAHLDDAVGDVGSGRARELAKLAHAFVGGRANPLRLVADVNEDRAPVFGVDFARPRPPREFGLEIGHEASDVGVRLSERQRTDLAIRRHPLVAGGHVVGVHEPSGLAAVRQLDGGDQIEPQADQIHQIVTRERLASQVRMDEPQAAKPTLRGAQPSDVGQHQLRRVADDHGVDLAGTVHQHADLAPGLERYRGQRSRELRRGDVVRRYAASVEALKRPQGRRRQSGRVSVNLNSLFLAHIPVPRRGSGTPPGRLSGLAG